MTPIEHDQLYAQLTHEVFSGARYWLNDEETQALMAHNEPYRELCDLSEMVDMAFEHPTSEVDGEYLTTYDLIDCLAEAYPQLSRSNHLNSQLGKVMRAKHFVSKHRNTGVVYLVKRKR